MARWQPARADVLAAYAREVLAVHPRGRLIVGVDGIESIDEGAEPSAREAFGVDLAAAIAAEGVPARALGLRDLAREPRATAPERVLDEDAFRAGVLQPFRAGDLAGVGAERSALVVSGPFLHLGDWAGMWRTSAWLAVPRAVAAERDAARLPGADHAAWAALVEAAFRRADARKIAPASFDLTDADHPRRVFADAC